MNDKTKIILFAVLAVRLLYLGVKLGKGGGRVDETSYTTAAEAQKQAEVIASLAEKRGETPAPAETGAAPQENELLSSIERQALPGSYNLASVGYDPEREILLVEFALTKQIYAYYDFPQGEWERFAQAEKPDTWFDVMIKNEYRFERIN
jgi:hypothetical protein